MEVNEAYYWLVQSERRKKILVDFNQPLTASYISRLTNITLDSCLHLMWGLTLYNIIYCLNNDTRNNRLYWLTELGKECQRKLRKTLSLRPLIHCFPNIPWNLFSSVCYSHRSSVIKAMRVPMQAASIKRKAFSQNPNLRMSANNVRDVIRWLLKKNLVRKILVKRKSHPRYELTDLGKEFKELLVGVKGI